MALLPYHPSLGSGQAATLVPNVSGSVSLADVITTASQRILVTHEAHTSRQSNRQKLTLRAIDKMWWSVTGEMNGDRPSDRLT